MSAIVSRSPLSLDNQLIMALDEAATELDRGPMSKAGFGSKTLSALDYSERAAVWREKRKRPREVADRNVMCDEIAEAFTGKPGMQMKRRRLDLE